MVRWASISIVVLVIGGCGYSQTGRTVGISLMTAGGLGTFTWIGVGGYRQNNAPSGVDSGKLWEEPGIGLGLSLTAALIGGIVYAAYSSVPAPELKPAKDPASEPPHIRPATAPGSQPATQPSPAEPSRADGPYWP
jgi:hypothetical protein